ncbi:MAG: phosphate ABC transporter permease PstA [Acidimicrobiia bacterium]|nr:phosphate ABC transporter permease PstA [Acidimicrobiia bacterium]
MTGDPTVLTPTQKAIRSSVAHRRPDVRGAVFQGALLLSLLVVMALLVTLLMEVARDGFDVFAERGGDFLTSNLSSRPERAGVWQGIKGSLLIAAFVVLLAFPLGIATAVYLEEYAPDNRLTRFVDLNIRNLAGVPSVVYGILGLVVFVKWLGGSTGGRSVISGGITMSILVLPIVIITSAEAVRSVPRALREGGYGIGATPSDVVRRLVLPSAAPGILTGTVLSLSRALGETAPLILVGAVGSGFYSTGDQGFFEQLQGGFSALPMIVYGWARQPRAEFRALTSATIIVLLAITLLANATAILLRNRYEQRGEA